jgi:hypothetical protein
MTMKSTATKFVAAAVAAMTKTTAATVISKSTENYQIKAATATEMAIAPETTKVPMTKMAVT